MASEPGKAGRGVALPPAKAAVAAKFDLGIALALSDWHALTLAVQDQWGGPDSEEKRDWFAGAISDMFAEIPDFDSEFLEEFMLQIMNDEFQVNVEDGSGEEVADKILALRKETLEGNFAGVDEMMAKWEERRRKGAKKVAVRFVDGEQVDTDWDSNESDSDAGTDDVEMGEAPSLASRAPKEKAPPEVDEDGFTKVISKKKR